MGQTTVRIWGPQERIDNGEVDRSRTDQAVQSKTAEKRMSQLEKGLAFSLKVNEA